MAKRKYTYKLYPNQIQQEAMLGILSVHQSLYNAALQERIEAYRKCGVSIGYKDQARSLTELRQTEKWISSVNAASQQVTLKRLQRAFENFFRRVKEGQTPGFPRFKSFKRYPGWGYKQHGDGFRFHRSHAKEEGAGSKHGTLFLSGVGKIKARGKMRVVGSIKCAEILHKRGQWSLSLTVEVPDVNRHQSGTKMGAGDWGVETLLTIVNADGSTQKIENPRHYQRSKESMIAAQQALSRKKRYSLRWKVCAKKVSQLAAKQARQRKDFNHKISCQIAQNYAVFSMEKISVKNMTASASGTSEAPGKNVSQKAGLNREILDTAPAMLYQMISTKAEEAAGWFVEAPTRSLKPSQRCPCCWKIKKKALSERMHVCDNHKCGYIAGRDQASAEVVLRWLKQKLESNEFTVGNRQTG